MFLYDWEFILNNSTKNIKNKPESNKFMVILITDTSKFI